MALPELRFTNLVCKLSMLSHLPSLETGRIGELNGFSRKRGPVFVYSQPQSCGHPTIALTRCPQSVTAIRPRQPALSVRTRGVRASTVTHQVALGRAKNAAQTLALSL